MNSQARDRRRSGNPAMRAAAERFQGVDGPTRIGWREWIGGARLRTLPLAIAPIAVGAGLAHLAHGFSWTLSALALAVAVLLQIGVNYANDYSDGVRGTDAHRGVGQSGDGAHAGPPRLTASGLVDPKRVLTAALVCFALAAGAGLVAVILSERWWFLAIGVVAILAAWFYTGGKRPYGYAGLGEVAVFIFFGIVATVGTAWLQTDVIMQEPWIAGAGMGFFAVAVLVINNTRDIETDRASGKKTVSVRIGDRASRILFVVCALLPFAVPGIYQAVYPGMVLVWLVLLAVLPACVIALWARSARELVLVLGLTSLSALAYGVLLGITFAF